jgi:proline iminopeptidase
LGELHSIRGKEIYVERQGDPSSPPLVYLHGGPGSSCYDFMSVQGERLRESVYLIGMDQRGVLRSEMLDEDEKLSPDDIVEDAEELRRMLGISSWSVLGHSFGGFLAALYASKYPQSIDRLIFESPGFDFHLTLNSLLKQASVIFESKNQSQEAEKTREQVQSNLETPRLMEVWLETGGKLGKDRESLYFYGPQKDFFETLFSKAPVEIQNRLQQTQSHFTKLHEEQTMYKSVLNDLTELPHPSLIITSNHDFVFCEKQHEFVRDKVGNAKIITFNQSGHFPRIEEPVKYARVVKEFLLK